MAYITDADLILAIGREPLLAMGDPDKSGRTNAPPVLEAIKAAQAKIDRYLVKRYRVPIDTVPLPETIRQLAIEFAVYALKTRGNSMATTEEIAAEEVRLAELKDIASGVVSLDVDPVPPKSSQVVDEAGPVISAKKTARDARKGAW